VVDKDFLLGLASEREQGDGCRQVFVADFISGLPRRVDRLRLALSTADPEGALEAARALKVASQMVGAERLAGMMLDLEEKLRCQAFEGPATRLPKLAVEFFKPVTRCAARTIDHLQAPPLAAVF
jgi:HPt (histidine-containing phosphotransfer) domain-containing protein